MQQLKVIECPRDAMQGLPDFIPTQHKITYINALLKVRFDTLDFGSFVSPKAIPQMKDTAKVLAGLDLSTTKTKLLAIVANVRGAEDAVRHPEIQYLGFPLSISETFQKRNTNKSIAEAMEVIKAIQALVIKADKELVVYISMGFGNPYGEKYNAEIVNRFVSELVDEEIKIISLADTIGSATPELLEQVFASVVNEFPHVEIGAHFHSTPNTAREKIKAAWEAGCKRIDSAIGGLGGCPMAKDDLTGNIDTTVLIDFCKSENIVHQLDLEAYQQAVLLKEQFLGR